MLIKIERDDGDGVQIALTDPGVEIDPRYSGRHASSTPFARARGMVGA
ncbi:hypothetical protein [Paraburkholderia ferrariae]|uniref:Uncharacterized protein n=1 Tax=Paraburkholderia ferrariae TaxID=386056 RepID=A0ABU9RZ10_9BURK